MSHRHPVAATIDGWRPSGPSIPAHDLPEGALESLRSTGYHLPAIYYRGPE